MKRLALSVFLWVLAGSTAFAAKPAPKAPPIPPAPGWEITGTSSVALPEPPVTQRVEQRVFGKSGRVVSRAGFTYLSRGDFYNHPAISAELSYYPIEWIGVDLVASFFFSHLNATAEALRISTGLLPDSQKPIVRIAAGGRLAFAYGKLLIESMGTVLHFDANLALHLGALKTDTSFNPALDLGLVLQVRAYERLLIYSELGWMVSYESRTNTNFASGPLGTLGVGLLF
ncbi:MAG: hypothetical protein IPG45_07965 [Deltaproteobacteria bacterium]|nr:hypothetical protein [Deltaproteobacteria bacterium]